MSTSHWGVGELVRRTATLAFLKAKFELLEKLEAAARTDAALYWSFEELVLARHGLGP